MIKEFIVIHHSLTRDSGSQSWSAIKTFHMVTNGWNDIGYHAGVELIGPDYEFMRGRPFVLAGAHCREAAMNVRGIGVCAVGNFDLEAPPEPCLAKLADLVRWLQFTFSIPTEKVIGHRDAGLMSGFDWRKGQYKTCPGTRFSMSDFRARLDNLPLQPTHDPRFFRT